MTSSHSSSVIFFSERIASDAGVVDQHIRAANSSATVSTIARASGSDRLRFAKHRGSASF